MRLNYIRKWLILCVSVFIALLSLSCDRLVVLTGTVYEWTGAPVGAQSRIFLKEYNTAGLLGENFPEGLDLAPVAGARLEYSGKISAAKSFEETCGTDSKGEFRLAVSTGQGTGEYVTTLMVSGEGYRPVFREFIDRGDTHIVNVILVPNRK